MKQLCEFVHREYRTKSGLRLMDVVRQQFVPAGPEEYVRQDVVLTLHEKYGFPLSSLLCEEVVERGAKKFGRADVIVELPLAIGGDVVELGEAVAKPWWTDYPPYSTQYSHVTKALTGLPGLKVMSVADEYPLPLLGEVIVCRTLGFGMQGYGLVLAFLLPEPDCGRLNIPRVVSLYVQGYGMSHYEQKLAAELGIEQCEWTQPACEKAAKGWARCLPLPVCDEMTYYYGIDVLSSDGKRAWGLLFNAPTYSYGVLASLDTTAKGLKDFVRARESKLASEAEEESEGTEAEGGREEIAEQPSDEDMRTFIVVECKAPNINYTEEVRKQGLRYADHRKASFLVLTNGTWSFCHWSSPEKGWVAVDDIPMYKEAVSGK
ncbi:MAG: type I restriction enzyme HsdR N-terminal domain-containing protein, partial [Planctomycetota bacterium]